MYFVDPVFTIYVSYYTVTVIISHLFVGVVE